MSSRGNHVLLLTKRRFQRRTTVRTTSEPYRHLAVRTTSELYRHLAVRTTSENTELIGNQFIQFSLRHPSHQLHSPTLFPITEIT